MMWKPTRVSVKLLSLCLMLDFEISTGEGRISIKWVEQGQTGTHEDMCELSSLFL